MMTEPQTPFERIQARRAERDMSQNAICIAAGLNKDTLAVAKRRGGKLDLDTITAFGKLFGCTVGELLGEATAAASDAAATDPALCRIPLRQLARSHLNPRRSFNADELRELADSIAVQGLLQNLVVRRDADQPLFWIVAGERRYRALLLLQNLGRLPDAILTGGVPCRVIEADDAEHIAIALLENLQRVDPNPMDEAEAFARLQVLDAERWKPSAIAERIGKTPRHVQLRLKLVTSLSSKVQDALKAGKVTLAQARVLTLAPEKKQNELLKDIKYYPTADQVRRAFIGDMIPAERAIFNLADWPGEIVEDPDTGKRFLADRERFLTMQRAAADRRIEELKQVHRWVDTAHYFCPYDYKKAGEPGGAVVVFRGNTGEVEIHTGLKRVNHIQENTEWEARSRAAGTLQHRREIAMKGWLSQLGLFIEPAEALALVIFAAGCSGYGNKVATPLTHTGGLSSALFKGGPLKMLTGFVGKAEPDDTQKFKDSEDAGGIWQALCAVPEEDIAQAFVAYVVNRLRPPYHDKPHPALVDLSLRHGVEIPPIVMMAPSDKNPEWVAEIDRLVAENGVQTDLEDAIASNAAE